MNKTEQPLNSKYIHNSTAGEILKREFLVPLGISQNALAKYIRVPDNRIHAIVKGDRSITADTDLRLCKFFGIKEGFFLGLQKDYEMLEAKRKLERELQHIPLYTETEKHAKLQH